MASFKYNDVYIKDYCTIVGPKEKEGNIKFPNSIKDYYYDEENLEEAEIKMQNYCLNNLLKKNKMAASDINLVIGGDLIDQSVITSYNLANKKIPFLGVYNACSTFNEALLILANFLEAKMIKNGICITSSHNLNAERQYRFPIEYGAVRKIYSTFTTTGGAACLLTNEKTPYKIESSTIGKVVDYGIKDASNMGAIMAPSAALTLHEHLTDLNRDINYYDVIVTGDLGLLGSKIFQRLIKNDYNYNLPNYFDAASIIYKDGQNTNQGGSGPVVMPLILFTKLLTEKKYKKILLLATGSLHNPLMVNLKKSIPSITHAISIEVMKWHIWMLL